MKPRPPLPPGPYLVVGLARSGAAAARALREHGEVAGVDSGHPPEASELRAEGIEVELGSDGVDALGQAQTVVKSPGVPREAPVIATARERGIEVVGEMEVAWRLLEGEFVAVTGTNGKTTTVELIGAIHRAAGIEVAVAGNVGTPLASLVGELSPGTVVACEASSFQLEDADGFAPEGAALLNLSPDHLDRHGSFEAYRDAKLRLFANQGPDDVAVLPLGLDPPEGAGAAVVRFGAGRDADLALDGDTLRWRGEDLVAADRIRLRGPHNLENAMAAAALTLARAVPAEAVAEALAGFAGVPHRLEEVAERDGVLFVNDSKATNPASTVVALRAFPGGVHLIAGGSLKGGGFEDLREPVAERCRAVYLIGEAAPRLRKDLDGAAPLRDCGDLEHALAEAAAAARPGEVVLLSPACASYDQFRDFEERGERFRTLAQTAG